MIYLTAIVLTPGGSSTVHIYTQKIHRTTQSTQTIRRTAQFTNISLSVNEIKKGTKFVDIKVLIWCGVPNYFNP